MWNFIIQIYYRCRIKRRMKEVKTGAKRKPFFNKFADPLTTDDLLNDEWV